MSLLTDDQKMLQETAASFLGDEGGPAKQLRHWRDTGCTDGYGTDLWKQFGELGFTGICIPESQGGLGLGAVEAAMDVHGRARARGHGRRRAGAGGGARGGRLEAARPLRCLVRAAIPLGRTRTTAAAGASGAAPWD